MQTIGGYLAANTYPGRGILLGLTPDASKAVLAYFIMGRSENSRNRVFVADGAGLKTQAYDPAKLTDPSLIIYNPLRVYANHIIITNGDQTDTVCEAFCNGESLEQALRTREYEPDAPHFTPRISGLLTLLEGKAQYKLSILKKGVADGCLRCFYEYDTPQPGCGHFIHTYMGDANPLPSFTGEPVAIQTANSIDAFAQELWAALDADNRVALHVRYIDLASGSIEIRGKSRFEMN